MDSEIKAVETIADEKKEAALDTLYPKPENPSTGKAEEVPASVGGDSEKTLSLTLSTIRASLAERIEKINRATTKDGSAAGVGNHGTRLMAMWKNLDKEIDNFANFLAKEGHE